MSINPEKRKIIEQEGNVLVTANPGTGKTRLLAYKYIDLVKKGVSPEQILCLTFTDKAKREMESRILEVVEKEKVTVDLSKLNVFTFHSYALDNIAEKEVLSTGLLRYSIFKFLNEKKALNYTDDYLLGTLVPRLENLMRYLKSFGIMPDSIDLGKVKPRLEGGNSYTKEDIDRFAEDFTAVYSHYEDVKNRQGVDYADLLIRFLQLKAPPEFEYVLVDELQDVNVIEADIALKSGKQFFAVGDKKQAIFGFQGGSIQNFEKFGDSSSFVLSENFRSTDEILSYAKNYFISNTNDQTHKEELSGLRSADGMSGSKPVIYDVGSKDIAAASCELLKAFKGRTAIIARKNHQIGEIADELTARGIEFSSTYLGSSDDAKKHIVTFLQGVLSNNVDHVKQAMFTPFFPGTLQESFAAVQEKLAFDELLERIPAFKKLRERVRNVEDVNVLFKERLFPVCVSYGKEYLSAAKTMQKAYREALMYISEKEMLLSFLRAADLESEESDAESDVVVTTVHKAKGKEFENVIYIPGKTRGGGFEDKVVEAIVDSHGLRAAEELEEETLRVNFVAFTRAEKNLVVLTDKVQDFLTADAELKDIAAEGTVKDPDMRRKRAYSLFVNGELEEAKKLLVDENKWMRDFIKGHFDSLRHTSFSSLPDSAYEYLVNKILGIREMGPGAALGSSVHAAAEKIVAGLDVDVSEEVRPFAENVKKIIAGLKHDSVEAEKKLDIPLSSLGFDSSLRFKGFIDAVFKDGDTYLLVDWKTDKNDQYGSKHRQQLEAYKRAFCLSENVPSENVRVAIAYIGLRGPINNGVVGCRLDTRQPVGSAFSTFSARVERLLSWADVDVFFKDLVAEDVGDMLWESVVEEWGE
jgi:DNA helicase II / ATP-dependent DNA helicase PcrA